MWIRAAVACVGLSLSSASAIAQDEGPEQGLVERAEALLQEGVQLRKSGDEHAALTKFREAHALHPTSRSLAQMGLAEKSIRTYVDAERHLEEALADTADPWIAENRETLERAKAYVAGQLAWVEVTSNVDGAELSVNGVVVGRLPMPSPFRVPAGLTVILVRQDGFDDGRSEVTLVAGDVTPVRVELTEERVLAPPPPAVVPIAPAPISDAPPPSSTTSPYVPWALATSGVAIVGFGIGAAFGIRTLDLKDERDEVCPTDPCSTQGGVDLDRDARTFGDAATVSFVIGGTAAVASVVLWVIAVVDEPAKGTSGGSSAFGPSGVLVRF